MRPSLLLRALPLALAAAAPLSAQTAGAAYTRVAGCYAIERVADAPWLLEVEPRLRLTLDPLPADPGSDPQYAIRPAGAASVPGKYPFLGWSLFGDGEIVSIVWSSDHDQVGLNFVPRPDSPHAQSLGSTTFFTHEQMRTSPPVDVRVTAIDC